MPTAPCSHCAQRIEFPPDLLNQEIPCPTCGKTTRLTDSDTPLVRIPHFNQVPTPLRPDGENHVATIARRILANVERVVVGKSDRIQLALMAWFADGHVLLEDVPGVAKTMLARALARSVGCTFKRIQCTPDLLPSDITGASVYNPKDGAFEFRPGPVFTQILLADEINRATPRTQSALLEAMAERQVTADGDLRLLPEPFFLIATQNPIDHEGTFPLPEAQLDRFLIRLSLGYPTLDEEINMIERLQPGHPIEQLEPVASAPDLLACQSAVRRIHVDPKVRDYIARIVRATRDHDAVVLGASPRAALALCRAAQAYAAIQGFDFVIPDDLKTLAPVVLAHRLILKPESRLRKTTAAGVLHQILDRLEVPAVSLPSTR